MDEPSILLTVAFPVIPAASLMSLNRAASASGRVSESMPVAAAKMLELVSEAEDN